MRETRKSPSFPFTTNRVENPVRPLKGWPERVNGGEDAKSRCPHLTRRNASNLVQVAKIVGELAINLAGVGVRDGPC